MHNDVQKSVMVPARYPEQTAKEIDRLVDAGFYKSRSDALRDAARRLVREHYGILKDIEKHKSSAQIVREIRQKMWQDALSRANGNEEKAAKLLAEEANKIKL